MRFSLLSALSTHNDPPEQASRPFSKNRDGFVIAEGAAALVLEDIDHARARGARILGIVEGCGEKADSFHRTRSSPDGKPIIASMRNALADAGVGPDDVDYINAHGTSTPENDKMEYLGVSMVFGDRIKDVPISSNKSMIGHTLTAAGAVEAAFTLLTLATPAHAADDQLRHSRSGDSARRRAQRGARCSACGAPCPIPSASAARTSAWSRAGTGVTGIAPHRSARDTLAAAGPKTQARCARSRSSATARSSSSKPRRRPPPGAGEVQIAIKAVGLNHIDVWGWRGMAFAKRKLPLVVGAEASGEIVAVGAGRRRASRPATGSSPTAR